MVTALDLPIGFHADVPESVYHARVPGLVSKHALDLVRRSPAHYWAWVTGSDDTSSSKALDFGKACHVALLEPERFERTFVVEPDFGSCRKNDADGTTTEQGKINKTARDAWRAMHHGAQLVSAEDYATIVGMARSIAAHPIASRLFAGGTSELTLRWTDPDTGLPCKGRTDYYREDLAAVVDLKSTENASCESFRRDVAKYGYHRQHAHYGRGFSVLGRPLKNFVFVPVEKTAPYAVAVYCLDAAAESKGVLQVVESMRVLDECMKSNTFPGYPATILTLELPAWA